MPNKVIVGGMPDTMEYYSMFAMELKLNGPMAMLSAILLVVVNMIVMNIQYNAILELIDGINAEWAK